MKSVANLPIEENEAEAIRTATELLRSLFPVKYITLFGSKARGDDDEESDIDLLVVIDGMVTYSMRKGIVDALFDVEQRFGVILSPLTVSESDWNDGVLSLFPITEDVREDGIAL